MGASRYARKGYGRRANWSLPLGSNGVTLERVTDGGDANEATSMNYEESWPPSVTWDEAKRELEKHSADIADFEEEHGAHPEYQSRLVLGWLGY